MKVDLSLGHTQEILSVCEKYELSKPQKAYVLATALWESGKTMRPVVEAFWQTEEWRRRNLRYYPWYGRGFVQLTWEENYRKAGEHLGVDLCADKNRALKPETAAEILVLGMRDGWFTGKKLKDFICGEHCDYVEARRIINGTDKAEKIAGIAKAYEEALCVC